MQDLLTARVPLLQDLVAPEFYELIQRRSQRRVFNDKQLIHHRGDTRPALSIVESGCVRVGNVGVDGSYLTTSILTRGQTFGEFTLLADLPRTHEATAVGATVVTQLSQGQFRRLYRSDPQFSTALLKIALLRTHAILEFVDDLRRLPLTVRVAKFFLARAQDGELRLRQEDLSFTFGVSRVSMGKALKQLATEGVLTLGYGRILLHGPQLRDWVAQGSLVAAV